jgi:superfamily II DNA or RNA helicase/intein/homing endonuclease
MKYALRDYQQQAVETGLHQFEKYSQPFVLVLPTGCHAKDTEILMFDGSIKKVQDIKIDDEIMGPDSKPRKILRLHRGREVMYRITPKRGGSPFVVNGGHILSLVSTNEGKKAVYPSQQKGGEMTLVSVDDYIKKSKSWKHLRKIYRAKTITFRNHEYPPVPPWILGVILGDGSVLNRLVNITTPDAEVIDAFKKYADELGIETRISDKENTRAVTLHMVKKKNKHNKMFENPLTAALVKLGIEGDGSASKKVPNIYKTGTIQTRLEILAGLLDSDGSHDGLGGYDFISKSKQLSSDVAFIARSLGLSASESESYKQCQTGAGGYYHRVNISGDTDKIPCRIKRKQAPKRKQKKNSLVSGFDVKQLKEGDYYGFELDGDHLYLTADFFVHHNSGKSLVVADLCHKLDEPVLILQPSKEILEQNFRKLLSYGVTDVGIYSASFNSKRIGKFTYATIGSIYKKPELFSRFKKVIIDECHLVNPKNLEGMYNQFFNAIGCRNVCGLTATPYRIVQRYYREDGALWYTAHLQTINRIHPFFFKKFAHVTTISSLLEAGYLCPMEYKFYNDFDVSDVKINTTGADFDDLALERFWTDDRLKKLSDIIHEIDSRCTSNLIFCSSVRQAQRCSEMLKALGLSAGFITSDHPDKERDRLINDFRSGRTKHMCNVGVLTTGFDYPELDCITLARPTMSLALLYQMCGRGMRIAPGKKSCLIVDITENIKRLGRVETIHLAKEQDGFRDIVKTEIGEITGHPLFRFKLKDAKKIAAIEKAIAA